MWIWSTELEVLPNSLSWLFRWSGCGVIHVLNLIWKFWRRLKGVELRERWKCNVIRLSAFFSKHTGVLLLRKNRKKLPLKLLSIEIIAKTSRRGRMMLVLRCEIPCRGSEHSLLLTKCGMWVKLWRLSQLLLFKTILIPAILFNCLIYIKQALSCSYEEAILLIVEHVEIPSIWTSPVNHHHTLRGKLIDIDRPCHTTAGYA